MQQLSAVELGSSLARAAAWTWLADLVTAVFQHCNPDVNHTEMDLFIYKINLDVSMMCCPAGAALSAEQMAPTLGERVSRERSSRKPR